MTGNPQLTERQETLLRQAEKCRELANRLRVWTGNYDQNCENECVFSHMHELNINNHYAALGLDNGWDLFGFAKDFHPTYNFLHRCAHDGTPTSAAAWLEQHALELEAQV